MKLLTKRTILTIQTTETCSRCLSIHHRKSQRLKSKTDITSEIYWKRSRKNSFKYKPTTSTKDTGAKSRPIFYNFDSSGDSSSEEEEQEDQDTRKDDEEQDDMLMTKESKDKFVLQKSENKVDGDSDYFGSVIIINR